MKKLKVILAVMLVLSLCSSVTFASTVSFTVLPWSGTLNMYGETQIQLPKTLTTDGMSVERNGRVVPSEMSVSKNILKVSPTNYFEGGAVYNIKLFGTDGKKYVINAKVQEYVDFDNSYTNVIEISPKPSKGFNYPYILTIPSGISELKDRRLLVRGDNTSPSTVQKYFEEFAYNDCRYGNWYNEAMSLGVPLLTPVFPRDRAYSPDYPYMQFLNRGSLTTNDSMEKRADLQLIAMIKDAQQELEKNGIIVPEKVFIDGYSSDGKFSQRFTLLHPEYVMACVAGGVAGTTTLPMSTYNGATLPYPVGVADLKELTGSPFNSAEYSKVPQLFYMGEQDTNDATTARDCFTESEAQLIWKLLGKNQLPDRWNATQDALKTIAPKIEFKTFSGIGHQITQDTSNYVLQFFKNHWSR